MPFKWLTAFEFLVAGLDGYVVVERSLVEEVLRELEELRKDLERLGDLLRIAGGEAALDGQPFE